MSLLTIRDAADRMNCTEAAFRHKIRARQIPAEYVVKTGRSYRIKPDLFAVTPAPNVVPFARPLDEAALAVNIARALISEFAPLMARMLDEYAATTIRKVG